VLNPVSSEWIIIVSYAQYANYVRGVFPRSRANTVSSHHYNFIIGIHV